MLATATVESQCEPLWSQPQFKDRNQIDQNNKAGQQWAVRHNASVTDNLYSDNLLIEVSVEILVCIAVIIDTRR